MVINYGLYIPEDCLVTSSVGPEEEEESRRARLEPLQGHVGVLALWSKENCESINTQLLKPDDLRVTHTSRYQNVKMSESTQCRKYRSTIPVSSGPGGYLPDPCIN